MLSAYRTREFHLIDPDDQLQREYLLGELRKINRNTEFTIDCLICSRMINLDEIFNHLMNHLNQKYQIEKQRLQCCHCLQIFSNRYQLELHHQSVSVCLFVCLTKWIH